MPKGSNMKYCVTVHGPFGHRQRGEDKVFKYDTVEKRETGINGMGSMCCNFRKFEEADKS